MARNRNDETRLVIYLAQTGGGKTAFIRQMMDKYNAVFCEADRTWGKSYASPAYDICKSIGLPGPWRSARSARSALITEMRKSRGFLCIDEANTFGKEACDLIKAILNQTSWTVVITAIPIFFDKMLLSSWDEAKQMLNRAVAVVRQRDIDEASIRAFFEHVGLSLSKTTAAIVAEAANTFGGYRMVQSIREDLQSDFPNGDNIPAEAVRHAANACLHLKGFYAIDRKKGFSA